MTIDYRWVLELIDKCYGAATNDDYWPTLLGDIRQFLDGHGTTLFFTDNKLKPVDQFFGDNISPEAIADYQAHYHTVDIRMQRSIPGALNTVATDHELVDESLVSSHEFYQDFLRPIGHRYIVATVLDLDDGHYAFCSSHRGLKQDHADSDILDRARLIMPHLRRSLQLRRRLSLVNAQSQAALEVLDGLSQAVFLISAEGRILWHNAWATRLLDQRDGVITADGELRAGSAAANTELQKLVKSSIDAQRRPRTKAGGMMSVPRPSLRRAYLVLVTPLAKSPDMRIASEELPIAPSTAIFIMDPEQKPGPRTDILRTLYNLTPAEARLATAVGAGISIKAYAENAKLSIHYVRWLLKQVEAKTETRRITELIQLLTRQNGFFGSIVDNVRGKEK